MMTLTIDHFAFEVADLRRSVDFYRSLCGFTVEDALMDLEEHEDLAVLALNGGRLELIQALTEANQPAPFARPVLRGHFCPHLALQCRDLDGVLARIREMGVEIVHGPLENEAARWVYVLDPDGNVIEFCQDLAGQAFASEMDTMQQEN